jgi:G3E family GTPase
VDEARRSEVLSALEKLNPRATLCDAAALLGLLRRCADEPALPPEPARSGSGYFAMSPAHELAHDFVATTLALPPAVHREKMLRWIDSLPPEILRVKGIARFHGEPDKEFLVEKTDEHKWGATALLLAQPSGLEPAIILIGVQLDHSSLQAQAAALG